MNGELPKSQLDAIYIGARKYFTGHPCKHGHVSPRWTDTSNCCQCTIDRVYARRELVKAIRAGLMERDGLRSSVTTSDTSRQVTASHESQSRQAELTGER